MKNHARSKADAVRTRLLRHINEVPRFRRARQSKALLDAIQNRDSNLALWLLRQGFDVNARDNKGRSALWWAATVGQSEVVRQLVNRGAKLPEDVLFGPVDAGDEQLVRFLVRKGANVNCVSAVYSPVGHFNIKQVLLTIALGTAAHDPKLESIPICLIKAGAKINRLILPQPLPGGENRSMLGLAAFYGLRKTVQAMLAAGADVNFRDGKGRTALFDALTHGHESVAKLLLRAGARINVKDATGITPLESLRNQEQSPQMIHTDWQISAGRTISQRRLNAEAAAWHRQRARMITFLERHKP